MIRSIRARLTLHLLATIGVLIVAAGAALEITITRWLEAEFDRALEAKARALATLTRQQHGVVELDFADEFMPEFSTGWEYFELWVDAEDLLERSESFEIEDHWSRAVLPRERDFAAESRFVDVRLPDGRSGRLAQIDFVPQIDAEGGEVIGSAEVALDPSEVRFDAELHSATLLVAREREGLDAQILQLRSLLAAFAAVGLASLAVAIAIALKVGLRPLSRLVGQVRGLDVASLHSRIEIGSPPREIAPVVEQLNALLSRLDAAFQRERQLTSDIAHELKTPIAELRNLCEVGNRWPDDAIMARRFFEDAWTVARHMERIVGHLLALARCSEGQERVSTAWVDPGEALREAWKPLTEQAMSRGLRLRNEIPEGSLLATDPDKFGMIVSNLLSNAVAYGQPGTAVTCKLGQRNGSSSLSFNTPTSDLEIADLEFMFDRFWRKDKSRSGGEELGLGLGIVQTFADLLGFEIETRLGPDSRFEITLSWSS